LQAVPFNVNAVGTLFVPLHVPLKPAMNVAPLPMLWFHCALLATVTCALLAGCENETGQPFWMRWPFGKEKINVQPFVMAGPVFVIAMFAPKPLPPSHDFV
jgi:hypothetical protein